MKGSELFGVIVRTTGFLLILYSLWNLWSGGETLAEGILSLTETGEADWPTVFYYVAFGIPGLVAGAACFFLADIIVQLAYRKVTP